MNFIYEIIFFKHNNFIVNEFISTINFRYGWTNMEIHEMITGKHYYRLDIDSRDSLNRVVIFLKENHPEILI